MITEDYVSLETAKLLKEKGFDEEVQRSFFENDDIYAPCDPSDVKRKDVLRIPTLQMAMKWLREEHKMFICMLFLEDKDAYGFTIEHLVSKKYIATSKSDEYSSYEQACEAAIKYCLENLF